MSIKKGFITGVVVGAGLGIVLLSLQQIRPFSPDGNAFVEKMTFRFCPLYSLGFTNIVHSMGAVVALTILGNAVLYGVLFAGIAALISLFNKPRGLRRARKSN